MDRRAISKAKARLGLARKQLDAAAAAKSHPEFADHWYLFLIAAKNVYTVLEQGAKISPQSRQWFGGKKEIRRTDELLQYLFQARDDDEHGLGETTKYDPGFLKVGTPGPGHSRHMNLQIRSDGDGNMTIDADSLDGRPIGVQYQKPHSVLLTVNGRGNVRHRPPRYHLGQILEDRLPMAVGKLGLAYLEVLVSEAEAHAA